MRIVAAGAIAAILAIPPALQTPAAVAGQGQPEPAQAAVEPIRVEASPGDGFHQPYLLVVPTEVTPGAPILVALPTPQTSTDPAEYLAAAQRMATNAGPLLSQLKTPILVPVLPRPPVKVEGGYINLYIPALSRAALETDDPELARMDRQVLAMVDHARRRLQEERNIEAHAKAIFAGFSAGGHFATRMAILHPQRVLAVWSGGTGGHPILPVGELEGQRLTYPVGVADLEQVAGEAFDAEAFAKVPMLIIQGDADTNASIPRDDRPSDSYSSEQARLVLSLLGESAVERLKKVEQVYEQAGSRAEFRVYPGAGHEMTPEVVRDMLGFISRQIEEAR
jgi:predicted esterase